MTIFLWTRGLGVIHYTRNQGESNTMFNHSDQYLIALTIAIQYAEAEKDLATTSKEISKKVLTKFAACAIHLVGKEMWQAALASTPK